MFYFYILLFLISCFLLFWSGKWLVDGLVKMACFLKLREFVIAFFIVAVAGSAPNFFFGILSALKGVPQLSFGDTIGGNLIDLTVIIALSVFVSKGIPARSKMVQSSAVFTFFIAILPLFLIFDGILSRGDGAVLISAFVFYVFWLFSKKERFSKTYNGNKVSVKDFKDFFKGLGKVAFGIIILLAASKGMVEAAFYFGETFHFSLVFIGMFVVAIGNAFPEAYFTILSARQGQNWMLLGDLMGVVIVASTLVLGIVAIICPIEIASFSPYAVARFFLVMAALFFLIFVRTDRKITKKEGLFLLGVYIAFVITEILVK
ncbi:MAG: sodium:calcium antiporter [Minisyncoccales bacterium]